MPPVDENSDTTTPETPPDTPSIIPSPSGKKELVTSSLDDLQSDEERRVLDTVEQVRRCGLENILSLPQLVVCGDQSAGKSSVLEALTEIPFPRNDNLCTRFATEISLRRAPINSLTIKVIPDNKRSANEQTQIKEFKEVITDFNELPRVMDLAMAVMGILADPESDATPRAFSRDVLSIVIEGPSRQQLTLVDIPGLIATHTKGTTSADVDLVAEITDHYISQHRTICLAVVSATSDYANQKILEKVRMVDPYGSRTLGIITKPDRLEKGSGSEQAFIQLARNQDVKFNLGWHVLKNRSFEQREFALEERNSAEEAFFRTSNFSELPPESVGIDALRSRLSVLLFEHIKKELPKLRQDLETHLLGSQKQLELLGNPRSTVSECKTFLSTISTQYRDICMAALNGHYGGGYFQGNKGNRFSLSSTTTIRRTRAVVQVLNGQFAENLRKNGHKYQIDITDPGKLERTDEDDHSSDERPSRESLGDIKTTQKSDPPLKLTEEEALKWVRGAMDFNRGKELSGNFNPLLIGDLFWEQCSKWVDMADSHIDTVSSVCCTFVKTLLQDKCPKDVMEKIWAFKVQDALKARAQNARDELLRLKADLNEYPINYNHYYTDTIAKRRQNRIKVKLAKHVDKITTATSPQVLYKSEAADLEKAIIDGFLEDYEAGMEDFSCQEALDCLFAIYKVSMKTFIANVTTQVIERHIVRGLEQIFSNEVVIKLSDEEILRISAEKASTKARRDRLEDQIKKLEEGKEIFKSVM